MLRERLRGMALSLRKQPGRTLLLVLAGTSLVLFFLNQSDLRTPFTTQPAQLQSGVYSHRRIQDYSSPEYTAPGDTGGGAAPEALKNAKDTLKAPIAPTPPQSESSSRTKAPQGQVDNESEHKREEEEAGNVEVEEVDPYGDEGEDDSDGMKILEEEKLEQFEEGIRNEISGDVVRPIVADNQPALPDARRPEVRRENELPEGKRQIEPNGAVAAVPRDSSTASGTTTKEADGAKGKEEHLGDIRGEKANEFAWIDHMKPATKQGFIDAIIEKQREVLAQAMQGYSFHPKLKARSLDDLLLEKGGKPVRSIVITTWRSGSTFIGDVLQSHPATYYHYEPLLDFEIKQVRYGELAKQAVHNLRHLLTCNYTNIEHYLEYGPEHPWLFLHNTRLWYYCTSFPDLCWDPDFLSPFCKLFPFQSLKTVRLRLNLTREFLEDKQLGVQVLLLVRDPRGTMQSRKHRDWCPGNPDCDDPARLCSDLVSDYNTALEFRRKFPHSFRVVRYEDLSFNAYNMTKELFDFFHLRYHPRVQSFLDTHTKEKIGGASSTFRDSKTAPVHWQQDLSWEEVDDIQKVCNKALKLWGYARALNEKHLRSFKPVRIFKFR